MSGIDDQIQRAMQDGKFDDLKGKGRPLRLDDNPHADPEMRLAYHVLQNAGYSLPWIESRRELEARLEAARLALRRGWQRRLATPGPAGLEEWQRLVETFQQELRAINRQILTYNLEAPTPRLHLLALDLDAELSAAQGSPD